MNCDGVGIVSIAWLGWLTLRKLLIAPEELVESFL
jgi:hypothetical protein